MTRDFGCVAFYHSSFQMEHWSFRLTKAISDTTTPSSINGSYRAEIENSSRSSTIAISRRNNTLTMKAPLTCGERSHPNWATCQGNSSSKSNHQRPVGEDDLANLNLKNRSGQQHSWIQYWKRFLQVEVEDDHLRLHRNHRNRISLVIKQLQLCLHLLQLEEAEDGLVWECRNSLYCWMLIQIQSFVKEMAQVICKAWIGMLQIKLQERK